MIKYIYPKFSKCDLMLFRLGGSGLGNLLFTYSRCLVIAKEQGLKIIWPTWPSIKIGPWIRHEKDKRFYGDLFINDSYIGGIEKTLYLCTKKKIYMDNLSPDIDLKLLDAEILVYSGFKMKFDDIVNYREYISGCIMQSTNRKYKKALYEDFSKRINVHVRLGDFGCSDIEKLSSGADNTSIPLAWYVKVIHEIQAILGDEIGFNIFSDGTDEQLRELLSLNNVRRVFYGSAIADIIALSRSKVIVASGSSFSMWARFLGNCSCITFTNQLKECILKGDSGFEYCCSLEETLDDDVVKKLRIMFSVR